MPAFSREELLHIARLARLMVPEEAVQHHVEQMESILGLFEGLRKIDTSAIGPVLASFTDLTLTPREDVPIPSLAREAALTPSGRREGDEIAVPRVLGGTVGEG